MATEAGQEVKPDESGVTVEGMSAALDTLVKAADATDVINKGDASGIEHSGHIDERGKVGGGRATSSDAGGLDKMMIAKMTEAGIDLSTISGFNDYMVGKAKKTDDEENEENKENGNGGGDMEGYKKSNDGVAAADPEPLIKSMDDFKSDPDIANAVDVSPYLEAMTVKVAEQIDGLNKSVSEGNANQVEVNRAMAGAMHQMGGLLKSQDTVITELATRLGIVERTPNAPKGKLSLTPASALNKSMPGEVGGMDPLSKSELLSTLTYMNLEKSIKQIGPQKTSDAIFLLDGGNVLDPSVEQAAQSFLAANPNEAAQARKYC